VALELRYSTEADLPQVLTLEADPDVAPWITRWPRERHLRAISDPDETHMTFWDGNRREGYLLLAGVSDDTGAIELRRIVLARRGAGHGAQALRLALRHCFGELVAARVWLDVVPTNERALRLYAQIGFSGEGPPSGLHPLPARLIAPLRVMSISRERWAATPAAPQTRHTTA
jgi:RimJ/RimL family protein N-acetyltransferase